MQLDRTEEAIAVGREVLEVSRAANGDDHPTTIGKLKGLGALLYRSGKRDEGMNYSKEALELFQRVHGLEHPDTLHAMGNVCDGLTDLGRLDEARGDLSRAAVNNAACLGGDPLRYDLRKVSLGAVAGATGRLSPRDSGTGGCPRAGSSNSRRRRLLHGDDHWRVGAAAPLSRSSCGE